MREIKYIIGICDDEELMLKINELYLRDIAKKHSINIEILCFDSGNKLIEYARSNKIDIAFLDIDMKGMTGIQTAVKIKSVNKDAVIVFVTGHVEFAVDAFDADAVGYLLKPVLPEKIEKILMKSIRICDMSKNRVLGKMLIITEDNLKKRIPQYKISYIEKIGNQCTIHTANGTFSCYAAIGKIKEELEDYFWQVNQGIIVNKKHIASVIKNEVILKDGEIFTMGRKYSKDIKNNFFQE